MAHQAPGHALHPWLLVAAGLELIEAGADARQRQRAARDAMAPLVGPWVQVVGGVLDLPFTAEVRPGAA